MLTREQRLELQAALETGAWMLVEAKHGVDIAKQNAALRECVAYARSKRGKDFEMCFSLIRVTVRPAGSALLVGFRLKQI